MPRSSPEVGVSVLVHARVVEQLTRLRLRYVAERLDAVLADAARSEPDPTSTFSTASCDRKSTPSSAPG
jgi:hypothetical protein